MYFDRHGTWQNIQERYNVIYEQLQDEKSQRKLILVIVSIALLLDNMLYMVIVPIIPPYFREHGTFKWHYEGGEWLYKNGTHIVKNGTGEYNETIRIRHKYIGGVKVYEGEESAIGILFASKAAVQLCINPFSGMLIDRIGYDKPMLIGLTIMFFSTSLFALGESYPLLFMARSLQGVGSAFADTAGLAMIADRFTEENERQKALGIALAFISFGSLFAPPFGSVLYALAGKELPFLILAFVCLFDGILIKFVMKPVKDKLKEQGFQRPKGTPIWRLFMDKHIAICAGCLVMANVSLAFLEPTITSWMDDNFEDIEDWQNGMIWLPAFFPHVFGVITTCKVAQIYPRHQWMIATIGLAIEGLSCLMIPFTTNYWLLMIPICFVCYGIALVDTALLPLLGFLVDLRYVSVYGSIYAIADISYSLAYALGPVIAGGIMETIGFTALNVLIALSNVLYVPIMFSLKHIYDYAPNMNEANVLMQDDPDKRYQVYKLEDQGVSKTYGALEDEPDDVRPLRPIDQRQRMGNINGHVHFDDQQAQLAYDETAQGTNNPFNPFSQQK